MGKPLEIPVIPAKNSETPVSGVLITSSEGEVSANSTLPQEVQNNIDAEKIKFSDSAINNSNVNTHGFIKKLSGVATQFMNGVGNWSRPATLGEGVGNIWWVKAGETVIISDTNENIVTNMIIDGILINDGKLIIGYS